MMLDLPAIEQSLPPWVAECRPAQPIPCVVVHPCDAPSLGGAIAAARLGFIEPILFGPSARIEAAARELGLKASELCIEPTPHSHASALQAAQWAAAHPDGLMMKGSLHTDELVQAILDQPELRTGRRMSHVFRFEVPRYGKSIWITDAALNIAPTLPHKVYIVQNAIDAVRRFGVDRPKVAILSAVEMVNPAIPSTLDAAALCKMADRGQIHHAELDGPLAFDNAISMEAARTKGIVSPVAGQADILVVPDLEAGNMLAKQLEYWAGAFSAGLMIGARLPVVLTSRADGMASRVASVAMACRMAQPLAS